MTSTIPFNYPPLSDCEKTNDLWFEDGGLVIQAGHKLFKVFRGLITVRSSVFKDILSFPQPAMGKDTYAGCPLVRLHDDGEEVYHFLMAIFNSSYIAYEPGTEARPTWSVIKGVLRLSHKYDVPDLKRRSLRYLSSAFPSTLSQWDNLNLGDPTKALIIQGKDVFDLVLLLNEVGGTFCLPSAFYWMAKQYRLLEVMEHWKSEHALLQTCVKGFSQQANEKHMLAGVVFSNTRPSGCQSRGACQDGVDNLRVVYEDTALQSRDSWNTDRWFDPLTFMKPALWGLLANMCPSCMNSTRGGYQDERRKLWNRLPEMYGLPKWDELERVKVEALSE